MRINETMEEDWTLAYNNYKESGQELSTPSETLIRLLKGDYLTGNIENYEEKSICDVGFGNGNNLFLYKQLNMDVHGVELSNNICDLVNEKFEKFDQK